MNTSINLTTNNRPAIKSRYSRREESMNMISHIVGIFLGLVILIMSIVKSAKNEVMIELTSTIIYGLSVMILYACSSYYHGLKNPKYKQIFRILDHCTIYLLIAGTYTPVALGGMLETNFQEAITMIILVWSLAIIAIVLNAINLEKFKVVSMLLNLLIGWMAIFFVSSLISAISLGGFLYIIVGGIIYTIGAVLYGIGRKKQYFHFIFHILCLLGTVTQFIGIYLYCI